MLTANHFQDLILMMATLQSTSVISARRSSIIQNLSPATGSTTLATPRVSTASISSPRWGHSTVTSGRSTRQSRARGLSDSSRTQSWTSLSVSRYFTILSDKIYISLIVLFTISCPCDNRLVFWKDVLHYKIKARLIMVGRTHLIEGKCVSQGRLSNLQVRQTRQIIRLSNER